MQFGGASIRIMIQDYEYKIQNSTECWIIIYNEKKNNSTCWFSWKFRLLSLRKNRKFANNASKDWFPVGKLASSPHLEHSTTSPKWQALPRVGAVERPWWYWSLICFLGNLPLVSNISYVWLYICCTPPTPVLSLRDLYPRIWFLTHLSLGDDRAGIGYSLGEQSNSFKRAGRLLPQLLPWLSTESSQ